MATFTIDSENNIVAHAAVPDNVENAQEFDNEKDLAKLAKERPGSRLLDVWNSFAGIAPFQELKSIKKFTNRSLAVARVWAAVQRLVPEAAKRANDMAPRKGKAPKVASNGGRRARARKGAPEERTNKKAEVVAMVKRAKGTTLAEIMQVTGWLAHTVRGFVSILGSKSGEPVESSKERCSRAHLSHSEVANRDSFHRKTPSSVLRRRWRCYFTAYSARPE